MMNAASRHMYGHGPAARINIHVKVSPCNYLIEHTMMSEHLSRYLPACLMICWLDAGLYRMWNNGARFDEYVLYIAIRRCAARVHSLAWPGYETAESIVS
jgi:hypothetical protein